jgi:tetratricopeptide (TPR) repeat protein
MIVIAHRDNASHYLLIARQLRNRRLRLAAACALCVWSIAVEIPRIQSQTIAIPGTGTDAEFYLKRGESLAGNNQYDRAIADYTTAIQLKPDYAEAYNDRGFAFYLKGSPERAIADYTRAIELRPNYPKAYNSRGVVYMSGGYGAAKSVPDFDRAIELKPDFRYAYINRANARLMRHPLLALEDFHRAGMHPERKAAILIGVMVLLTTAILSLVFRKPTKKVQ